LGRQHEETDQEEHDVDHGRDLKRDRLRVARFLELHAEFDVWHGRWRPKFRSSRGGKRLFHIPSPLVGEG
jgi:hypothetical protein